MYIPLVQSLYCQTDWLEPCYCYPVLPDTFDWNNTVSNILNFVLFASYRSQKDNLQRSSSQHLCVWRLKAPQWAQNTVQVKTVTFLWESAAYLVCRMKIAVEGCCHGELDKIYETIAYLEKKEGVKVDLLLCCGDFQAVRNEGDMKCMAVPAKYRMMQTFYKSVLWASFFMFQKVQDMSESM